MKRSDEQVKDGSIIPKKCCSTSWSNFCNKGREELGGTVEDRKCINLDIHDVSNLWPPVCLQV